MKAPSFFNFLFVKKKASSPSPLVHAVGGRGTAGASEAGRAVAGAGTKVCVPLGELEPPDSPSREWTSMLFERARACIAEYGGRRGRELRESLLSLAEKDFPPTAVVVKHPRRVVVGTPYMAPFVEELKSRTKTRRFDVVHKVWYLDPSEAEVAQEVARRHFPRVRELYLRPGEVEEALKMAKDELTLALKPYRALLGESEVEEDRKALRRIEKRAVENVYYWLEAALTNLAWM